MTTIVGFKVGGEHPGVVLASDVISTRTDLEDVGNILIKRQTRHVAEKIQYDRDNKIALSLAGRYDGAAEEFIQKLLKGDIDMAKCAVDKTSPDFAELNFSRQDNIDWDPTVGSRLLVAYQNPDLEGGEPNLYSFHPLGLVNKIDAFETFGSGSPHARRYIDVMASKIDAKNAGIPEVVELARGAIKYAGMDLYTGGLDMVVLGEHGLHSANNLLKRAYSKAEKEITEGLKGLAEKAMNGSETSSRTGHP